MCGENASSNVSQTIGVGSPPRVRGKLCTLLRVELLNGITPACAGKTYELKEPLIISWDHPRVCGENMFERVLTVYMRGSPPRVRGKPCPAPPPVASPGITPACAGKTILQFFLTMKERDHPRVCGENEATLKKNTAVPGSPPRVRGKLACTCVSE